MRVQKNILRSALNTDENEGNWRNEAHIHESREPALGPSITHKWHIRTIPILKGEMCREVQGHPQLQRNLRVHPRLHETLS